jgi:hypothetical protein
MEARMKRVDIAALILCLPLIYLAMFGCERQHSRYLNDERCKLNLKSLSSAILNFDEGVELTEVPTDRGSPVRKTPVQFLRELAIKESPFSLQTLVCRTDSREAAKSPSDLAATNISYFLSRQQGVGITNRIIAGDRNIMAPGNLPFTAGLVHWSRNPPLHTNTGWLVMADTTVLWATNGMLLDRDVKKANIDNQVFIP